MIISHTTDDEVGQQPIISLLYSNFAISKSFISDEQSDKIKKKSAPNPLLKSKVYKIIK